jgi:hypothetical protein
VLYNNQFIYCGIIEKINDTLKIQLKLADFAGLMQMAKKEPWEFPTIHMVS